jgi:hypothetical protein
MVDLGPSSENEMVLAFLRAEIDAPRYRDSCSQALQAIGRSRATLIDAAALNNDTENRDRAHVLRLVRGYGANVILFHGFPNDVAWQRYEVSVAELGQFLYANWPTLLEVAGSGRLVSEGAKRATFGPLTKFGSETKTFVEGIRAVVKRVEAGGHFADLIAVRDIRSSDTVLIEGHTRATAYVIARKPTAVRMLLGTSSHMHEWWLF